MPYVSTRDATRLFYIDAGAGRPVLFVSSAWLDSRMWEHQLPYLVDHGYRCVAYDRRGHGRSDSPWFGYDYDTLADDLAALIEALNLRDLMLVSHSAGAGEIVRCLSRHGARRVASVALVSPTTPFPMRTESNPTGVERALMEADVAERARDRARWFAANAPGFFGPRGDEVSPELSAFMVQQCLTCSPRATSAFFVTAFETDFRAELAELRLPALVVHGDRDLQAPLEPCGRATAQLLPDGVLRVYEGAAHGLFITHAARLNADLLEHAHRCEGRK